MGAKTATEMGLIGEPQIGRDRRERHFGRGQR